MKTGTPGIAALMLLAGCAAGPAPRVQTPAPALPAEFLYAPEGGETEALNRLLPSGDPAFDILYGAALADSPTLGEAAARVERARAGVQRARAEQAPQIDANASTEASRTNPGSIASSLPPGISIDREQVAYAASLTARWEIDLFGRLRAQRRAAAARLDAANADAAAVRNALTADIAGAVVDWRSLTAREIALRDDLSAGGRLVDLTGSRERAGLDPGVDRIRAQSVAEATRSRLAALDSERSRLIGRLVTLTARDADFVRSALSRPPVPAALPDTPAALPSSLLANRPDIRAAAARLAATDADLSAAAARRFPRISLSGAIGLLAFDPDRLFDDESVIWSLAAAVAGPLVDFGRVGAEIDVAAADKRAAFQSYRNAVYTALGDAEAAYGLIAAADGEALATQREAERTRRAAGLVESRYRAGLADFLSVLDARRSANGASERAAAAAGRARRARILLWQALGGERLSD